MTTLGGPVTRLAAYRDGSHAAAILADGTVAVVDLDAGEVVGSAALEGAVDLAAVDDVSALLVLPAVVEDAEAAAAKLVGDPGRRRGDLPRRSHEGRRGDVRIDVVPTTEERAALKTAIDAGEPPGRGAPAGLHDGGRGIAPASRSSTRTPGPRRRSSSRAAPGLAQVTGVDDGDQLYVTAPTPRPATPRSRS